MNKQEEIRVQEQERIISLLLCLAMALSDHRVEQGIFLLLTLLSPILL